jgi:hypothetical protein
MGACSFERISIAKNYKEALASAKGDANDEIGHHQGYSGDINSCSEFIDKSNDAPRYGTKKYYNWV